MRGSWILWNLAAALLALAALESGLDWLLDHPRAVPAWSDALRRFYHEEERRIIQFLPECARWDPRLTYTLEPGSCRFANREFDVEVRVNSAGLRDTESALRAPEIVALGDSFTMGWGVAQDEAFPQVLRARSGRRVLNAGISSFGTAGEVRLLERLDLSALDWLLVQYAPNDHAENALYREHREKLETLPREAWRNAVEIHRDATRHWPGRLAARLLPRILNQMLGDPPEPPPLPPDAATAFLETLAAAAPRLGDARVAIFELDESGQPDRGFLADVERALAEGAWPRALREARLVDVRAALAPEHYFALDSHLAARGHRRVAEVLCGVVGCPEPGGGRETPMESGS